MIILLFFLMGFSNLYAQTVPDIKSDVASIAQAVKRVDTKCLQLRQHGACMVGRIPGVKISYYEPTLIMKTFGHKAHLNTLSGSHLTFTEVHIYDFPFKAVVQTALCASLLSNTTGMRYLSELDQEKWHREKMNPLQFIGSWGPLYPRTGFVNHYSPVVSSALTALRGISAAGILSGHVVTSPVTFFVNHFVDKMQMVEPDQQRCMALGIDARYFEKDHIDVTGEYTWIYWRFRQCCKTVAPDIMSF